MAPVAAAFRSALGLEEDAVPESKYSSLLEKKWTSVVRLQRKVGVVSCGVLGLASWLSLWLL